MPGNRLNAPVAETAWSCQPSRAWNNLSVKLSAIGDVVHTQPALMALRRHYPQAHISWLVEESGAELLRGHAALDRLILWRRRQVQEDCKRFRWMNAAGAFFEVLRQVRDRRYDLVIDFQALLKSALWVFLTHGVRKVGFGRGMQHAEGSYLVLNERIPAVSMEVHALDRGLTLLEGIGVPRGEVEYGLTTSYGSTAASPSRAVFRAPDRFPTVQAGLQR